MIGASVASWALAAAFLDARARLEVFCGMIGPLVVAVVSWIVMERAHRRSPQRLTAVMTAAFAAKLVVFGAYVVIMVRGLGLRPAPFAGSFAGYFMGLYAIEALFLKRLLSARSPAV